MITLEEYQKMVSGETGEPTEEQKALAQKIYEAVEQDVEGLKGTNLKLKDEKTKAKEAFEAEIEKLKGREKELEDALNVAKEQIQKNSPEEAKKYYDQQLVTLENGYKVQLAERDKRIAEKEDAIKDYERKDVLRSQEVEFERLVRKTNADPGAYDTIKTIVLGNGDRFDRFNTGEGETFLAKDGSGKSIGNVLTEYLQSPTGKRLCNFSSSGSGAEGGSAGSINVKSNPFKAETWNLTEQMKIYREDQALYNQLKAAAGRS